MTQSEKAALVQEFYNLNQEYRAMEKILTDLKDRIKTQVGAGKYGEYLVLVDDCERETFSLKEARKNVTEAVWNKIKDFVSVTNYQTLKVSPLK